MFSDMFFKKVICCEFFVTMRALKAHVFKKKTFKKLPKEKSKNKI